MLNADSIKALANTLPDDPFCAPPAAAIRTLVDNRELAEPVIIELLQQGTEGQRVPNKGYRNVYLMSLLGEWRAEAAIPAIVSHLGTPWGYGWDEVVHACARIGAPALVPMIFASFDRTNSTLRRRRAMRAFAGVASAAQTFGDDSAWIGDSKAQYQEATEALRILLSRHDSEVCEILDEAAARLCDLRCEAAWPEIEAAFHAGRIKERDGFTIDLGRDLITGRMVPFEIGSWRLSMIDWMLKNK